MPTVEITFTPSPAHVRTARLVALTVARRSGVPDELLDEVRLAVGEACTRAVGVHAAAAPEVPVRLRLSDDRDSFIVEVSDVGEAAGSDADAALADIEQLVGGEPGDPPGALPPGFGLAVIAGLVEDMAVLRADGGTTVRMSWPAGVGASAEA